VVVSSIGELIDRTNEIEDRLLDYYAGVRDQTSQDRVRLLTYHLRRHHSHLQDTLDRFEKGRGERIRAVGLQNGIGLHPENFVPPMATAPTQIDVHELIDAAIVYDMGLIDLYARTIDQVDSDEAIGFLNTLIGKEQDDIRLLKRMCAVPCV